VFFFSAIRYDIGADYEGYYKDIELLVYGFQNLSFSESLGIAFLQGIEPLYFVIVYLCHYLTETCALVYAVYSALSLFFLYKALDKYNAHKWGLMLLFLTGLLFNMWDALRQSLSIPIVLLSMYYIDMRDLKKFSALVLLAFTAHYSALIFITAFFFAKIKTNKAITIGICLLLLCMAVFNVFVNASAWMTSIIPYYSEIYMSRDMYLESYSFRSPSYLFECLWLMFIIAATDNKNFKYRNLIGIGTILFIVSGGTLNIFRMALYFISAELILFPSIIEKSKTIKPLRLAITVFLFMYFILFNIHILSTTYKGCSPYETVFSKEFVKKEFRLRDYKN